ncbi:Mrp/NBP35 family ATP-binding protein [Veillonella sp. YH-vei2232]|jgi:Mrp family chromosome partitioning ATPase|uniref:Iron-sulfur cluster carrier protein n=1 Tax=Veillonella absiana TaxID=3079305 RepID=A0ABU3Z8X0_9FIRM|nr:MULTISPECIES: Mrp/NBP35 family ATP-binding protein [unclassified Veillonella]MBP6922462.1 Mrp/NBP35 family ATP-binding protein [Veillonella sp.]MBP8617058.1 Mrp/NBP35 family ATP-binding protein [Veillonella sp.]MBP9551446.1 Mrp/NBP35 family ATP-binding protein [Veillonella sp.]MDV5062745.1 Mrp/NBP35 family ATP-binding protein [Veillonella sp. YH-vei2232]MDV5088354.1 Mrp/NBP35 family ATP-binding protein [Veillonella sp. YH-vei2233]
MGCSDGGCGGCPSASAGCGSANEQQQQQQPQDMTAPMHELSNVKHVIGIVSGKGGVGKSSVTSLMAITQARKGYKTAILDADITGPSIPKVFGLKEKAYADEIGMYPVTSKGGVDIMSVNLLLENDTDPVLWRGPILGNVVKQFYSDVIWKDIDYMFVDMPPGTGDVAITVYQSLKLDGIIIVTSPQDLVSMIVEKAVKMADMMQVPIIGVVENYSYFHCPDNGKDYKIFGESHIEEILQKYGLLLLGRLPIDPTIANLCDNGALETIEKTNLEDVALPE